MESTHNQKTHSNEIFSNNYSLAVLSPVLGMLRPKTINNENYYEFVHGEFFKILLSNYSNSYTEAHLWLNGTKIGVYTLKPYHKIMIDQPQNSTKYFLYNVDGLHDMIGSNYQSKTALTNMFQNGNIVAIFKPESKDAYLIHTNPPEFKRYNFFYNKLHNQKYGSEKIIHDKMPLCSENTDFQSCSTYLNKYNQTSHPNTYDMVEDLSGFNSTNNIKQVKNKNLTSLFTEIDQTGVIVLRAQITTGYDQHNVLL
jgi:hypothetical protein